MYEPRPCPPLKTCPFCGGEAKQEVFRYKNGYFVDTFCARCEAVVTTPVLEEREIANFESTMKWNRRVENVPTL